MFFFVSKKCICSGRNAEISNTIFILNENIDTSECKEVEDELETVVGQSFQIIFGRRQPKEYEL